VPVSVAVTEAAPRVGGRRSGTKACPVRMAIRVPGMRRILSGTGALRLRCGPAMSRCPKLAPDAVFGPANFRSEIIWRHSGGGGPSNGFGKNAA